VDRVLGVLVDPDPRYFHVGRVGLEHGAEAGVEAALVVEGRAEAVVVLAGTTGGAGLGETPLLRDGSVEDYVAIEGRREGGEGGRGVVRRKPQVKP
jgi:hypothetical protein